MYIVDSVDGRKEEVHLDKITSRIQKFCYGLNMDFVDPVSFCASSGSHRVTNIREQVEPFER